MNKRIALALLFCLLLAPLAAAQDNDNPTVAILRFGPYISDPIMESGLLDTLQVYEWISAEERALLNAGEDIQGEKINIFWSAAGFDLPTVNILVEDALDRGADILVTSGAPVTQIAIGITQDQDEPTPVLFHGVNHSREYGISDSSCLKPAHVTGSEYTPPFDEVFEVFLLQNPALQRVGTIHTATDAAGIFGAARIQAIGESKGIEVESAAIAGFSDLRAATQSLVSKGVEAIVLPIDFTVGSGLPVVVSTAKEQQIPIFYPVPGTVMLGVTVGVGFFDYYAQGIDTGLVLNARFKDGLDFNTLAVNSLTGASVGVNIDVANEMEMDVPQELRDMADITVSDGAMLLSQAVLERQMEMLGANDAIRQMVLSLGDEMDWSMLMQPGGGGGEADPMVAQLFQMLIELRRSPENVAADAALLEARHCTDDMIAEQQAALDAGE